MVGAMALIQDDQDRIAFLHLPSEELARACEEAARVLDGRVVSKYLLNDVAEKVRIARDLLAGARVRDQGQDGIAEKPGGRFVGLGEKANAVGDDHVDVLAPEPSRLRGEGAQKTSRPLSGQERAKEIEEMAGRRLALLDLLGRAER